jgi:hypothetical protein
LLTPRSNSRYYEVPGTVISLAHRLQPEDIELKLRILSDCVENPFLDLAAGRSGVRFGESEQAMQRAMDDLCACGIMSRLDDRHAFRPS